MGLKQENLDFDRVIDRRNTDCLMYDVGVRRGKPADILPLWVADMGFQTSQAILDALHERVSHGIFGYTEPGERYFEAVAGWMESHHGWQVKQDWLVRTPGVVFALAMAVKAYTEPGESVLIQSPVYYPFSEVIRDNGRKLVENELVKGENGRYYIDFADFEKRITENQVKLFLLCSPHNPVGRVWEKEELLKMAEICKKNDVIIVSDEIHSDFVFWKKKHYVLESLSPEIASRTVTCTAPSKTFNLAGMQVSNIFISNEVLRRKFKHQVDAAGYSQLNTLGLLACEVAYREGETWYRGLIQYLESNILFAKEYLEKHLPKAEMAIPEGTYLVWIDFRKLGLDVNELDRIILHEAKLWLDSGRIFGKAGEGFQRINVACPRSILEEALEKLVKNLNSY